ncbi:GspH/FimT family pseudopilin [Aidingimonas lacisalsi]|uniref:GspH/FimT family pseudopilin n=1 Tax=Aidingimonas lacisalsi TaxID=2604086 RepID=UPI001375FCD7|nr:GspH/FimT family pseudopilin [Aidingimonas lacisalsi]
MAINASAVHGFSASATSRAKPHESGITLLELLTVISLIVIMAAIAVPQYKNLASRHRVDSDTMRLITALKQARNTAVTQHTSTTLCPSLDQVHCTDDWKAPLMLFASHGETGQREHSNNDIITSWQSGRATTNYRGFGSRRYIRFTPWGATHSQNGTFTICSDAASKKVILYKSGRSRTEKGKGC